MINRQQIEALRDDGIKELIASLMRSKSQIAAIAGLDQTNEGKAILSVIDRRLSQLDLQYRNIDATSPSVAVNLVAIQSPQMEWLWLRNAIVNGVSAQTSLDEQIALCNSIIRERGLKGNAKSRSDFFVPEDETRGEGHAR